MLDLAIQILQAAQEEDAFVPETSQLKGSTQEERWRPRTVAGYVVQYAGTVGDRSRPLSYANHYGDGVVLIEAGEAVGFGTIFLTMDAAGLAITATTKYQKQNHLKWNEFYGDYIIDPVYA